MPTFSNRKACAAMGVCGHAHHENFQKIVLNVAFSCMMGSNLTSIAEHFAMWFLFHHSAGPFYGIMRLE